MADPVQYLALIEMKPNALDQAPDRGPGCKASRRERVACFYSATLAWNSTAVDSRHAGTDASHVYGGFLATLTSWCEEPEVPSEGVPVGTITRAASPCDGRHWHDAGGPQP